MLFRSQFWLTIHIPEDAKPGTYEGVVKFTAGQGSREVPLKVTVHPFELLQARLIYSIYYGAHLSKDGKPAISSANKSEEQYRAEIMDFKAHGVLYPTNYQGMDAPERGTHLLTPSGGASPFPGHAAPR